MKHLAICLSALLLSSFFLAGCWPEQRVVWSRDGGLAAVCDSTGLYLTDPAGKISSPVKGDYLTAVWATDELLIAVRQEQLSSWKEVSQYIRPADRERYKAQAARLVESLKDVDPGEFYFGDEDEPEEETPEVFSMATYLYIKDSELIDQLQPEMRLLMSEFSMAVWQFQEIHVKGSKPKAGEVLATSLTKVTYPRASADGLWVAYIAECMAVGDDRPALYLISPKYEGDPHLVCSGVSMSLAFSPDSQCLYYTMSRDEEIFGYQDKKEVYQNANKRKSLEDPTPGWLMRFALSDLCKPYVAQINFDPQTALGVLGDGRVVFSGKYTALPQSINAISNQDHLFAINPNDGTMGMIQLPPESEAFHRNTFKLSPKGGRLFMLDPRGRVGVFTFATNEFHVLNLVEEIDDEDNWADWPSMPCWRNEDQLCVVLQSGAKFNTGTNSTVALWTIGQEPTIISQEWPGMDFLGTLELEELLQTFE